MQKNEKQTVDEVLSEERDFSEEEIKTRTEHAHKIFRLFMISAGSLIFLLIILGILFGN